MQKLYRELQRIFLKKKYFIYCSVLFFISAVFLFKNLGNIYLNVDEAETALLAKCVLNHGIPIARDGNFIIQQNKISPFKSEASKIWIFHPWLQFYITAASFKIFGINTFTARLPFTLAAFIMVIFFFRFLKNYYDKSFFMIAAFTLLVFNIPFCLFARQCRYYILNIIFSFVFFASYLDMLNWKGTKKQNKEYWKIEWIFSTTLLFYSSYAVFFAMYFSIIFHLCLFHLRKFKRVLLPSMFTVALTIPGAIFFEIWKRKEMPLSPWGMLETLIYRVSRYFLYINTFHIAIFFVFILFMVILLQKKWSACFQYFRQDIFTASFVVVMGNISFFSCIILHDYRFFVHLITFLVLILAGMLDFLSKIVSRRIAVFFLLFLISGNYMNMMPLNLYFQLAPFKASQKLLDQARPSLRRLKLRPFQVDPELKENPLLKMAISWVPRFNWWIYLRVREVITHQYSILDYIYEITHDYHGPIKGMVKFLKKHAKKGDKVKIFYGDLSLQFYLGNFLNIIPKINFYDSIYPRWWIYRHQKRWYTTNAYHTNKYEWRNLSKYKKYVLKGYPNIAFNNLPSPEYHFFRTQTKHQNKEIMQDSIIPVFIYCRKDMLPGYDGT